MKVSNRKTKVLPTTASPQVVASPQPLRGQKEVVLPRPANPPRTPDFQRFVSSRSSTREREPSVYDTIKKLLHMEEQLEEVSRPYIVEWKLYLLTLLKSHKKCYLTQFLNFLQPSIIKS